MFFVLPSPYVRNMEVNTTVREIQSYLHIKNFGKIRHTCHLWLLKTMIHVFVLTKLDYANSLFVGLPKQINTKL